MQQAAPRTTLVLGGARSGKSAYAERSIEATPGPWLYLATAQAWDDEMRARIALHRSRRPAGWITRDVPTALAAAIADAPGPVLVDCLTLWLTNLLLAEADLDAETEALVAACRHARGPLVLVSNEVGLGIVPDNALARRFRDAAGRLHQALAAECDRVVLTVAGLPLIVKPQGTPGNAMTTDARPDEAERHREKMEKRKAVQDAEVAAKTIEKGLLIVNTGPGKGKTTAALGLALRMLGRGHRVGIVQFIKGAWDTGEARALKAFGDRVAWHAMGEGFTWETQDKARDIANCFNAWNQATDLMADPSVRLLILDELNIALRYDYLDLDAVVATLEARRPDLHVVVTGRNAKPALIEAADLVTEMGSVKHHFAEGVKAQEGIEF